MFICKLCGLSIEAIPEKAILVGKLHRFVDGSFHFLRKKLAPRTGPRPRKRHDQETPMDIREPKSEKIPTRECASEVPTPEFTIIPANVPEVPVNETVIQRAFRLKKVA
jgi:hypothetical protein